ncbi:hypothetical protein HN51_008682 [Arachis hypogaea]|uniref:Myb/SANT-like DNA-binding domain-containing protein n=2 Tax=Arachis TaxID=3817 RepID=A0A445D2G3_ARAHY|nr:trihelix transcription factor ENAP1 [Arachis duranensis]XP_025701045.1 trihelix transcription factor ASIL2 [Arachis hypogaea]XP_025701046.1 trihelix transcription factor ASIL2 [Arachis hypogaea]QHO43026.1 Trihelix transcription factor [Arachis hypogaea]RYR57378.1 hypothetical protein Ahy_A05g023113 [Arachis hypogaea]
MDDMEDDARYPPKSFPLNRQNPSHRHKHPIRPPPFHHHNPRYEDQEDDDYDDEEEHAEFENYGNDVVDNTNNEDDDDDCGNGVQNGYFKKRKVGVGGSPVPTGYEFAPRVKYSYGDDWSEHATFVLLEVWGDKFLQLGRTSLRSDDWLDVAEKVSDELKAEKSVAQCKSMLDKLKRRYKKEKGKVEELGLGSCKWAFFKKMDMLMASSTRQEYGLACGVDGGEYVFMNTRVYLSRSNGFDEMRDSPGESESDEDEDGLDGHGVGVGVASAARRRSGVGGDGEDEEEEESSFRVLADSIQKFGKIYEKIENSKRQQMMELEKMRLDFNRELELQKKQILERAQAEIAKIQDVDEDETDTSTENLSE